MEAGKVRYPDFLPQKGKVDEWKSRKIPVRLTENIKGFHDMLNLACGGESFKFWGWDCLSLLRFYMSDKGLTLGVWSHQRVNDVDDLYGELYYSEIGGYNQCIENGISSIVSEILRLGVPVRDVFVLLYGSCDKNVLPQE